LEGGQLVTVFAYKVVVVFIVVRHRLLLAEAAVVGAPGIKNTFPWRIPYV